MVTVEIFSRGCAGPFSATRSLRSSRTLSLFCAAVLSLSAFAQSTAAAPQDWVGRTFGGAPCTGAGQGFGPWDYFSVDEPSDPDWEGGRWWEVREVHAKPGLAALNALEFDHIAYDRASQEFDYILRAFPNHPDILAAVIQLELRRKNLLPFEKPWRTPPECYLNRAKAFRPKQPHIEVLFGVYLQKLGKPEKAIPNYQRAIELDPEYAEAYYNLGLAYFEIGKYGLSLENARKAYSLGFPLKGLQNKLKRAGAWTPS